MSDTIRAVEFQVIHFANEVKEEGKETWQEPKQVQAILIYALGEDGIVYEFAGGRGWMALPIEANTVKRFKTPV